MDDSLHNLVCSPDAYQYFWWWLTVSFRYPVYSFFLPIYSFWCMDEFGWGNTRLVIGEGGNKKVLMNEDEKFDDSMIPLKKFSGKNSVFRAWCLPLICIYTLQNTRLKHGKQQLVIQMILAMIANRGLACLPNREKNPHTAITRHLIPEIIIAIRTWPWTPIPIQTSGKAWVLHHIIAMNLAIRSRIHLLCLNSVECLSCRSCPLVEGQDP